MPETREPALYVRMEPELMKRLDELVERERDRNPAYSLSKADVVRDVLMERMGLGEPASVPVTTFKTSKVVTVGDVRRTLEIDFPCEQCKTQNRISVEAGAGPLDLRGVPCGSCDATYEFQYRPVGQDPEDRCTIINCAGLKPETPDA